MALKQTEIVKNKILEIFPDEEIEIVPIITTGDKDRIKPLGEFGGKGVFTIEIEQMLKSGEIDIAVHSAKDLPMESKEGLVIAAAMKREDAKDVLLVRTDEWNTDGVGKGKIIGTSSLRRELQIKNIYPEAKVKSLRGNVTTRMKKLIDGEYDGIILAAAGIKRLGNDKWDGISYISLPEEEFVPAAGQGIIAVQADSCRIYENNHLKDIVSAINDEESYKALVSERTFLEVMDGGCNAPCGIYVRKIEDEYVFSSMYAKDGKSVKYLSEKSLAGDLSSLKKIAGDLAEKFKKEEEIKKEEELKKGEEIKKGRVSIVGAGIGEHDMLTLKALECVKNADVIIYDDLLSPSILNEARDDAKLIYVGKRAGHHYQAQADIQELIIRNAMEGSYVVRLKGGDPFIFGRGGEEALALSEASIEYEVVSGVSSSYCVPAYAGIPVTHRGMASSFHVITGHKANDNGRIDYQAIAKLEGTLVFLMGLSHLPEIVRNLIENGMPDDRPAAVIMQGGGSRQRVVSAKLKDICEAAEKSGMKTPAVIVVGDTVNLREILGDKEEKILSGRKILLTSTRETTNDLVEKLLPLGAEPVALSLIKTRKLAFHYSADELQKFSQIVFLSPAGIRYFFEGMKDNGIDMRCIAGAKFVVIGESTAEKLKEYGYFADYIPESFRIKTLADKWVPTLKNDEKVLLIRSRLSDELKAVKSDPLYAALENAGIEYSVGYFYETYVDMRRKDELNRLIGDMDAVVVCSSSAAKAIHLMTDERIEKCVAIGPETERTLKNLGISVSKVAEKYNSDGIAEALISMFEN